MAVSPALREEFRTTLKVTAYVGLSLGSVKAAKKLSGTLAKSAKKGVLQKTLTKAEMKGLLASKANDNVFLVNDNGIYMSKGKVVNGESVGVGRVSSSVVDSGSSSVTRSELFGLSKEKKIGAATSTSGESASKNVDNIISEAERKGFRGVRGQIELHTPKGFGRSKDRVINGRKYWGHALDRMQDRGIPLSAVEDCIKNGKVVPSTKQVSRLEHYDAVNNIKVITDKNTGDVISVIFGGKK